LCFQCPHLQVQLRAKGGWEGPPNGATGFEQLYNGGLKEAIAYVADVVDALEENDA
jgi:hypothetical protein